MGFWRLGLVLFELCLCSESRGAVWETSTAPAVSQRRLRRGGWDLVPICSDVVGRNIWLVACKVRMGGEDCLIRHRDNQHSCDARFSLPQRNHTVFLNLTALTPADSGLYACRCLGGRQVHQKINITVTDDNRARGVDGPAGKDGGEVVPGWRGLQLIAIGVATTVTVPVVFVSVVCCIKRSRRSSSAPLTPRPSETACTPATDHVYAKIQNPDTHDYQPVFGGSVTADKAAVAASETDSSSAIYENI